MNKFDNAKEAFYEWLEIEVPFCLEDVKLGKFEQEILEALQLASKELANKE